MTRQVKLEFFSILLGNQGVHQVDVARWGLGVRFPNRVSAMGGHFMFDDDQETPNTVNCAFEFDLPDGKRKLIEFEVRRWMTNNEAGIGRGSLVAGKKRIFGHPNTIGNIFYGSNGYLATEMKTRAVIRLGSAATRNPGLTIMAGAITLATSSTACAAARSAI